MATTNCWFCGAEMIWGSDADFEDVGLDGPGIVASLSCCSCGASADFYSPMDESEDPIGSPFGCYEQMHLPGL